MQSLYKIVLGVSALALLLYFVFAHDVLYLGLTMSPKYILEMSGNTETARTPGRAKATGPPGWATATSCPPHGVVYARSKGRLGNWMWEYAATLVVGQRTGLQPVVHPKLRKDLDDVFVNLTVPAQDLKRCVKPWNKDIDSKVFNDPSHTSIQIPLFAIPDYYGLVEIVVKHQPDILAEFVFHQHLMDYAQEVLRGARADDDTVYVGVHVRRTDYIKHLHKMYHATLMANVSFFDAAMDVFRSKYQKTVFIVVSDDIEWCRTNLQGNKTDVITVQGTPGQDMATLAACNHTINDYGSFGEWGAMLSGGDTIVYDLTRFNDTTSNLATLLHWTILS